MVNRALENLVRSRAQWQCEYCLIPQSLDPLPFQIDHIIAVQHAGATIADNLALACFACNHHKGPNIAGYDPVECRVVPLFHPRVDAWREHFTWNGAELKGLTPVGRVTVLVLAINRDFRVAWRQTLIQNNQFPPRTAGAE